MRFNSILIAAMISASPASAMDVNGLELGSQGTPDQLRKLGAICPTLEATGVTNCRGTMTMNGVPVTTVVTLDPKGIVQMISVVFQPDFYDKLESAITNKLGKPSTQGEVQVSNVYGLRAINLEEDWNLAHGDHVSILKYCPNLDHGCIASETEAYREFKKAVMSGNSSNAF